MGLEALLADARFFCNADRLAHAAQLEALLCAAFAHRSVAECEALLTEAGVPAAPINDLAQVFAHPQVVARDMIRHIPRADGTTARVLASPIRLSRSAIHDDRAAPALGAHTAQVQAGWPVRNPPS